MSLSETMAVEVKKFKLREEKHVMSEVEHMAWSPSMDLLALANTSGEVVVNRLSWQRVWTLSPPSEGDKVGGLAWRPDGKVIAVGYQSGITRVCDVEKGDLVYIAAVKGAVTTMVWLEQSKTLSTGDTCYEEDRSEDFLPSAKQNQSLDSSSPIPKDQSGLEAYERFQSLTSQKELNLLIVGSDVSEISIFSYGAFPTAVVDLTDENIPQDMSVESALISPDLSTLSVVLRSNGEGKGKFQMKTLDTSLLLARHEEIRRLAAKYVMIASAQMELQVIIQQMCEAWEDILREMDSKLMKFAESKRKRGEEGSIGNDFLELLLFGTTSIELQTFLSQELTDKGLKKLGLSIKNSYSNIQKLVVCQLQRVSQNITSHLSDLYGMSQWDEKFGVLGLHPDTVQEAVRTAGAFAVSGSELLQVIDTSIKNFKAFIRWLYIAILRLSNEQLPSDLTKMTQHDINFVADFLRDNFTEVGDADNTSSNGSTNSQDKEKGQHQGFRLEKVGQYLKNENLAQPPNYAENPWIQFLNSSSYLSDSKILYQNMHGKSLIQRKEMLDSALGAAVLEPAKVIGASMKTKCCFTLFKYEVVKESEQRPPKSCVFADEELGCVWCAYVEEKFPTKYLFLLKHPIKDTSNLEAIKLQIGALGNSEQDNSVSEDRSPCERHLFQDFAVFNSQTLSLLLREEETEDTSLLVQLPLGTLSNDAFIQLDTRSSRPVHLEPYNIGPLLQPSTVNYQTNAVGHSIAVGGIRTTASLLLKSRRRIRLFLLEDGDGDDEDEDEDDDEEEESQLGNNSSTVNASVENETEMDGEMENDNKENMAT